MDNLQLDVNHTVTKTSGGVKIITAIQRGKTLTEHTTLIPDEVVEKIVDAYLEGDTNPLKYPAKRFLGG